MPPLSRYLFVCILFKNDIKYLEKQIKKELKMASLQLHFHGPVNIYTGNPPPEDWEAEAVNILNEMEANKALPSTYKPADKVKVPKGPYKRTKAESSVMKLKDEVFKKFYHPDLRVRFTNKEVKVIEPLDDNKLKILVNH